MNNQEEEEFQFILKEVLHFEGGYVNNPNDHGGQTNFGISQSTYKSFLNAHPNQGFPQIVRDLTKNQAYQFYKWFFNESKATLIKNKFSRLIYFDSYVIFGTKSRLELLQASLGSEINNIVALLQQINELDQTAFQKKFLDEREKLQRKNSLEPKQDVFLKGWLNRINELRKICKLV